MSTIDSLLNDNTEEFRKQIHDLLYDKIKDKLQAKKTEISASLYDESSENEPCDECEEEQAQADQYSQE